jgi:hypothetical protein
MEKDTEVLETQTTLEGETPEVEEETVLLTKAELDDLKHKADVSSQNFERAKKAEARAKELEALTEPIVPLDTSDENLSEIRRELAEVKATQAKRDVLDAYPILKDAWNDFESFRADPENQGMSITTAAKAFLIEKDLLTETKRKGLEKNTGGGKRAVPSTGTTAEEVKNLRDNNYREYTKRLMRGDIKIG